MNEASLRISLQVKLGNLDYQSRPTAFNADVSVARGPTPGELNVSKFGTDVDLSLFTVPGLVWMQNMDTVNFVEYGVWNGSLFFPLGELLPGEFFALRLSRNIGKDYTNTGTGITGTINKLRLKANTANSLVRVEVFEK